MRFSNRFEEFSWYHANGDGECNGITLRAWADEKGLSREDRADLAYFFTQTYNVVSAIAVFGERQEILKDPDAWADGNKRRLIFQSDRKYVGYGDRFNMCLKFWAGNLEEIRALSKTGTIDLMEWIPRAEGWYRFRRFCAFLFLETAAWLLGSGIINGKMDWKHGDTATSGFLNLHGLDDLANEYDRTKKLPNGIEEKYLDALLEPVLADVRKAGGDDNITMVETSLCAYRKFFKGTRYNGFYLDRMLDEINRLKATFPELCSDVTRIRLETFDKKYLGEVGGWGGIRRECKKLYKESGVIM